MVGRRWSSLLRSPTTTSDDPHPFHLFTLSLFLLDDVDACRGQHGRPLDRLGVRLLQLVRRDQEGDLALGSERARLLQSKLTVPPPSFAPVSTGGPPGSCRPRATNTSPRLTRNTSWIASTLRA